VCRACEGVEREGSVVKIASLPARIIPKSIASPSVPACALTGKFVDALPFYRQEKHFLRLGIKVSRTSMCNWAMKAAEACLPLCNLLQDTILSGKVVNVDETTVQVLVEPGRDPTTKSYMWVFRRGASDKTVLIYQYHPTRSGDVAAAFCATITALSKPMGIAGMILWTMTIKFGTLAVGLMPGVSSWM
jgi:transposase